MLWYEKLQKQCPNCKKYEAEELIKESQNYFIWICKFCGNKRKHQRAWAIYKHKNGKSFLKSNKYPKFTEVEYVFSGKHLEIKPVQNKLF